MSEKLKVMTLQSHLKELRKRIFISVIFFLCALGASYYFAQTIYQFLLHPLANQFNDQSSHRMIYTSPAEAFVTYLRLSLYSALFFSFPVFAAQFYFFLAPGLYKKEKKITLAVLFFSPFLFLCGAAIAYFMVMPLALQFFLSFENSGSAGVVVPIFLETRVSDYLSLIVNLLIGFGIAFQLPILLLFLIRLGFLHVNDLKSKRRYWIVIIFVVAAVLTPPDVLSQVCLAIPMILLLEIAILVGQKIQPQTTKNQNHGY